MAVKREDSTARRDRVSVLIFKNKLLVGMCGMIAIWLKRSKLKNYLRKKCVLIKYMLSLEDIQK